MSVVESQPRPDLRSLPPIGRTIAHDFYLSFRFSQGDPEFQYKLYEFLAFKYPRDDVQAAFPQFHNLYSDLLPFTTNIHPPKIHIRTAPQDVPSVEWQRFTQRLSKHHYEPGVIDFDLQKMLESSMVFFTTRDMDYQKRPRPGREHTDKDPHESFLRTYGVLGEKTTSVLFDTFFTLLRTRYLDPNPISHKPVEKWSPIDLDLNNLVNLWERNHTTPRQTFFPS